jgi:hypothetical protein
MSDVIEYIKKKRELTNEKDYKVRYIFENFCIPDNSDLYLKKILKMEDNMDCPLTTPKKMQDFFQKSYVNLRKKEKKTGR